MAELIARERVTTARPPVAATSGEAARTCRDPRWRIDEFSTIEGLSSKTNGPWKLFAYATLTARTRRPIAAQTFQDSAAGAPPPVSVQVSSAFFTGLSRSAPWGQVNTTSDSVRARRRLMLAQ